MHWGHFGGQSLPALRSSLSRFKCFKLQGHTFSTEFASISSYSAFSGPTFKLSQKEDVLLFSVHNVPFDHSYKAALWTCQYSINKENVSD